MEEEKKLKKIQLFCYNELKIFITVAIILIFISSVTMLKFNISNEFDVKLSILLGFSLITGIIVIKLNLAIK